MAWTTSASLCARPFAWDMAGARMKTVRFLYARSRRSLLQSHPTFAVAIPLAFLGLLTPLLPQNLVAGLLLSTGVLLAVLGLRIMRIRRSASTARSLRAAPRTTHGTGALQDFRDRD